MLQGLLTNHFIFPVSHNKNLVGFELFIAVFINALKSLLICSALLHLGTSCSAVPRETSVHLSDFPSDSLLPVCSLFASLTVNV